KRPFLVRHVHALLKRDVSHLTFPDEVQTIIASENEHAQTPEGRITEMTIAPPKLAYHKALSLINEAKRPAIIVGHGARFNMEAITAFAEKLNCPVLTTFKGKGLISDQHRLGCGVLGRSGTPIASWFMNESDLLIVIGASFSKHTGITPKKPTIQIDFDPLALSKFNKIDAAVWGEISVTVDMLMNDEVQLDNKIDRTSEIADRWAIWRAEKQKRLTENHGKGVSSIAIFDELTKQAPANAVMCVDVGNNAYSFGRYFETQEHSFLMSGYLGSIGFAFPAAMGAWAAVGDTRPVIAVAGDGGFCQYLAELTTAVHYNMPIKAIILNNGELGKISKEQRSGEFDVWATSLSNPKFAEYARGCGAFGIRVETQEALADAISQLMAHDGPGLVEVMADVSLI
ncbi:MAG: thiamine pyrophosphate-dependent enzyme, partial [Bacteroidota bacterium]